MKPNLTKLGQPCRRFVVAALVVSLAGLAALQAQSPYVRANYPMAQRNQMNLVLNQVRWFQSTTRTAGSYVGGGYGNLWQQFQAVAAQWGRFKATLTPEQLDAGANEVADLDAGLEIIGEAFADYQTAVANGQSEVTAFNNLRQVLNRGMAAWGQHFNLTCRRLRVGW